MSLESTTAQAGIELLKAALLSEIRHRPGLAGKVTHSLGFNRSDWPSKPEGEAQKVLTSIFNLLEAERKTIRIGNEWCARDD